MMPSGPASQKKMTKTPNRIPTQPMMSETQAHAVLGTLHEDRLRCLHH